MTFTLNKPLLISVHNLLYLLVSDVAEICFFSINSRSFSCAGVVTSPFSSHKMKFYCSHVFYEFSYTVILLQAASHFIVYISFF